jgi:hypothetical protein
LRKTNSPTKTIDKEKPSGGALGVIAWRLASLERESQPLYMQRTIVAQAQLVGFSLQILAMDQMPLLLWPHLTEGV